MNHKEVESTAKRGIEDRELGHQLSEDEDTAKSRRTEGDVKENLTITAGNKNDLRTEDEPPVTTDESQPLAGELSHTFSDHPSNSSNHNSAAEDGLTIFHESSVCSDGEDVHRSAAMPSPNRQDNPAILYSSDHDEDEDDDDDERYIGRGVSTGVDSEEEGNSENANRIGEEDAGDSGRHRQPEDGNADDEDDDASIYYQEAEGAADEAVESEYEPDSEDSISSDEDK